MIATEKVTEVRTGFVVGNKEGTRFFTHPDSWEFVKLNEEVSCTLWEEKWEAEELAEDNKDILKSFRDKRTVEEWEEEYYSMDTVFPVIVTLTGDAKFK